MDIQDWLKHGERALGKAYMYPYGLEGMPKEAAPIFHSENA